MWIYTFPCMQYFVETRALPPCFERDFSPSYLSSCLSPRPDRSAEFLVRFLVTLGSSGKRGTGSTAPTGKQQQQGAGLAAALFPPAADRRGRGARLSLLLQPLAGLRSHCLRRRPGPGQRGGPSIPAAHTCTRVWGLRSAAAARRWTSALVGSLLQRVAGEAAARPASVPRCSCWTAEHMPRLSSQPVPPARGKPAVA